MPTIQVAPGLFVFELEFEDGSTRAVLASTLLSAISGVLPSAVVGATRGPAFPSDGGGDLVPPVLASLTPPSAELGDPAFTLHVHGSGFRNGDAIYWNGGAEPTTFVSPTELTTGVDMSTAIVATPIPVFVRSIAGQDSNVLTFDLLPSTP